MKRIKLFLIIIGLSIVLAGVGLYGYLHSLTPKPSGQIALQGLNQEVEVFFDKFGIPHIYGQNEEDVYFALGYVHARERLFQMEMMRRVPAGRLSEILGKDLLETDRFFRILGLNRWAEQAADRTFKDMSEPYKQAALAYLAGVNQFVLEGKKPIEFQLIGIPMEPFGPQDIYLIGSLMAFGFAEGFTMDPITTKAFDKLGWEYLQDWALGWPPEAEMIPVHKPAYTEAADQLASTVQRIMATLPVAPWIGSNGWVLSPRKTASKRVFFANDTHMAYAQPSVWYEAHLECPGVSFYGNHAAGLPVGLIRHNRYAAWGLTMFENDDVDFFREKANPDDPNQVWVNDHWEDLIVREEVIRVKGESDDVLNVRISRHGPIISDVSAKVSALGHDPVSVWWATTRLPMETMAAFYNFAHAQSLDDARIAASMIDTPGLNVMYGDRDSNIAWWAACRLVKRPAHVNSKFFLDGASGKDEPLGWYDFAKNPSSENPPSGFVYSANNQPEVVDGVLYPGYYVPEDRAKRIVQLLSSDKVWTVKEMQQVSTDNMSAVVPSIVAEIAKTIKNHGSIRRTELHAKAFDVLENWDGDHHLDDVGPVIYNKLLFHIMENAMADELGEADFTAFLSTHLMKRTTAGFIANEDSLWWDDVRTADVKETRKIVIAQSFDQAVEALKAQFGANITDWTWDKAHTVEHGHLMGRKKPLDKIFNVGPFPVMGGNEVINNMGFRLNQEGAYKVHFGPAMRIILDFADIENSISVNPTGQSGIFMSPHYKDQAELFNKGRFRKQMMNRDEIVTKAEGRLVLKPK